MRGLLSIFEFDVFVSSRKGYIGKCVNEERPTAKNYFCTVKALDLFIGTGKDVISMWETELCPTPQ